MHLHSEFINPPASFRPMPFWFWNGKLEVARLVQQIQNMHQKGIGGFFIHARFGLDTAYMSPEWMDCVRTAIDAASDLEMEVWLYDEANFPSGLSDLQVTVNPEFRSHFTELTEARVTGPAGVDLSVPGGTVEAALAVRCEQGKPCLERVELTPAVTEGRLVWGAPEGEWLVMVFATQTLDSPTGKVFGVDYLNPDATRLFLETTHEVYAREIGEHFGKTVKGFFVDEPTLLPWHHDISWYGKRSHPRVVAWSPRLDDELRAQGRSPSEVLPHLFHDLDESTSDTRLAFYRTVSRLYVEAFFEPYRRWCDEHNLLLTGHLLLEEGLYCNTIFQADPVPALASMHIPGTDHLGLSAEAPYGGWSHLPRTMTNLQGEKLVASVSHLTSKPRTLSETFGCAGWGLTLEDMKRITDWQYGLGVDFMCPHALFYTIEGYRKADAPPAHNYNAFWPYYGLYSDYVARLGLMLTGGSHVCQVAVVYPLEDFQRAYRIGLEGEADRRVCDAFDAVCSVLPQVGFDFDIIPPEYLKEADVAHGRLRIGREAFDVVIVPAGHPADPDLAETLGRLERSLARVIYAYAPPADGWSDLVSVANWLRGEIGNSVVPDFRLETDNEPLSPIRCLHRRKDGREIYFVANTSGEERAATLSFAGEMAIEEWCLETGARRPCASRAVNGRTTVDYAFPPHGSTMLVSYDDARTTEPRAAEVARPAVLELGPVWYFETDSPNCLFLDQWDFRVRLGGNTERFQYRTLVEVEDVPSELLLLLDDIEYRHAFMGGMDIAVRVNDRSWRNPAFAFYHDPGFKTLDITEAIRRGQNEICVEIAHDAWSGEPKPLTSAPKLLGDFAVASIEPRTIAKPAVELRTGSWTDQGYPFYSGSATYSTSFEITRATGDVRVLVEGVGDVFEAFVNGRPAGVRPWRPWTLDISGLVQSGRNDLSLRVTNTMRNFIEGVPRPSGLLGPVSIECR